jgi:ribosomal protein L7Ae-like RNA K-turn-binding protein
MIYVTVPVTTETMLLQFLGSQLKAGLCDVIDSEFDLQELEHYGTLVYGTKSVFESLEAKKAELLKEAKEHVGG